MDIFKGQSKKNESGINTQRVVMESAQAQRVIADAVEQTIVVQSEEMMMDNDNFRTTKELEVYYPSKDAKTNNGSPASISKYESTPARNTRASIRQKLLSAINVSGSFPTVEQSASRSYPLKFLADFAGAVLDNETGKLLKYQLIIKRPK